MTNEEIVTRLKRIADHAVHIPGEKPFVMSLDDGIAIHEAIEMLSQQTEDAISRQAAIDALNQSINILDTTDRIAALPSVTAKQRWIPVSERLPEEYGEYLITWTGILGEHSTKRTNPLMAIAEYEIYEPENYADWITTMYEFEYYHDIEVLAWMPLPKPYKAESEN